jgi:isopenicillin N synthase-like dioxygenase
MLKEIINNSGFFYINIEPNEKLLIDKILVESKNYFNNEKDKIALNNQGLGYGIIGRTKNKNGIEIREMKESLNYRPGELDLKFSKLLDDYICIINSKAKLFFEKLMEEINIPNNYYQEYITKPFLTLSIVHYPSIESNIDKGIYGIYPHTDWGFLTFLYTNEIGLQIDNNEQWLDIPLDNNKFIINVGDMLEVLSSGKYKSTKHRVLIKDKEKYSIALFYEPNIDTIVKPYFETTKYNQIVFKNYFGNKVNETYLSS